MFGEKDEFLSIFNPLYFIETLGNDGQALLQKNLPLIDHKAVLERLTQPEQALLENMSLLSPETFLKTMREGSVTWRKGSWCWKISKSS